MCADHYHTDAVNQYLWAVFIYAILIDVYFLKSFPAYVYAIADLTEARMSFIYNVD